MKKYKFKVGDRVGFAAQGGDEWDDESFIPLKYDEYMEDPEYGVVVKIDDNKEYLVSWDEEHMNEHPPSQEDVQRFLMPEKDLQELIPTLEKEYNDLVEKLSPKLKEAAKLVKEAGKEAKKKGYKLANMHDLSSQLENAMDASGWHSSSWGC